MTFSKLGTDTDSKQFVYLPKTARLKGLYIVGLQGFGKSGLMENLIMQDIRQGIGVAVLDPKRDLVDNVIARLPPDREKDVILLDIQGEDYPFGLNLFECPNVNSRRAIQTVVDQVRHIFEKLLGVSEETQLILQYLYNCTYTLVVNPGYTMADIPLLLDNKHCRQQLVANVKDSDVLGFWEQYELKQQGRQSEESASTIRRVKQLLQPMLRPIVGQSTSTIDLQTIMNEGKILLVKLDRPMKQTTTVVGSILVALILKASASRPAQRKQFHLYADEFQWFATEDFVTLVEEARYADIGVTMAHQNRAQLEASEKRVEEQLKDRTLNVGSIVVFRVPTDGDELAGQFDTTPPPPQPEEKTKRAIQTPVLEPIQYMVSHGIHPLEHTRTFIETYGKELVELAKKEEDDERARLNEERQYEHDLVAGVRYIAPPQIIVTSDARTALKTLNGLFYQAMKAGKEGKNPDDIPLPYGPYGLVNTFILALVPWKRGYLDAIQEYQKLSYGAAFDISVNTERPTIVEWVENINQDLAEITIKDDYTGTEYKPFATMVYPTWYATAKSKEELLTRFETMRKDYVDLFANPKVQKVYEKYKQLLRKGAPDKDSMWWQTVRELGVEQTLFADTGLRLSGLDARKLELQNRLAALPEHLQDHIKKLEAIIQAMFRRQRNSEEQNSYEKHIKTFNTFKTEVAIEVAEKEQHIKSELALLEQIEIQKPIYDAFVAEFTEQMRQIMGELATPAGRVEADSGIQEIVMGHGIQLSSAEMEARIANQLVHLDQFTAWIKIAENISINPGKKCVSCSLLNSFGAVNCNRCDTKLPAPNEYIIETLPPEKRLNGKLLDDRIAKIQAHNRKPDQFGHVYCKSWQEVEAEIRQRQTGCGGSAPVQAQQQTPHARNVPMQTTCPSCGTSNRTGSHFCNRCGMKLT